MSLTRGIIAETTNGVTFKVLSIPQGSGILELPFNFRIGSTLAGAGGSLRIMNSAGTHEAIITKTGNTDPVLTLPSVSGQLVASDQGLFTTDAPTFAGITTASGDAHLGPTDVQGALTFSSVGVSADTPVADGTYTVGLGGSTNGTITTANGVIIAIQEAT